MERLAGLSCTTSSSSVKVRAFSSDPHDELPIDLA
jgi:hypothetical protein